MREPAQNTVEALVLLVETTGHATCCVWDRSDAGRAAVHHRHVWENEVADGLCRRCSTPGHTVVALVERRPGPAPEDGGARNRRAVLGPRGLGLGALRKSAAASL